MSTLRDVMSAPDPSPEDMQAARQALGSPFPYQLGMAPQLAEKIIALLSERRYRDGMLRAAMIAESLYEDTGYGIRDAIRATVLAALKARAS